MTNISVDLSTFEDMHHGIEESSSSPRMTYSYDVPVVVPLAVNNRILVRFEGRLIIVARVKDDLTIDEERNPCCEWRDSNGNKWFISYKGEQEGGYFNVDDNGVIDSITMFKVIVN